MQTVLHIAPWSPPAAGKEEESRTLDQALFAAAKTPVNGNQFFGSTQPVNLRAYEATETMLSSIIKMIWIFIGIIAVFLILTASLYFVTSRTSIFLSMFLVGLMFVFVFCTGMRGDMQDRILRFSL
jgi:hypothetical protein